MRHLWSETKKDTGFGKQVIRKQVVFQTFVERDRKDTGFTGSKSENRWVFRRLWNETEKTGFTVSK